jgi:hypothetical protein
MGEQLPGSFHMKPFEAPSAAKARASRENGRKGGRPKGTTGENFERVGRDLTRIAAPQVAAELVRLSLHAKDDKVRVVAGQTVLAYAWGRPAPADGDGAAPGQVVIVHVDTGVRG